MRVMRIMMAGGVFVLLGCAVLMAQGRANLSGTWEWVGAEGVSRDGVKGPVHVLEISGGAFNCGAVCTITQSPRALTISRPADEQQPHRGDTVLTFAAGGARQASTNAVPAEQVQWNGDRLVVTHSIGIIKTKQTVARRGNRLTVTSVVFAPGFDESPVIQSYVRK